MTPMFYSCKFCGEGFVTIYGQPCYKCRVMASSFKPNFHPTDWAAWCVTVGALLVVMVLAVWCYKPGWFQ